MRGRAITSPRHVDCRCVAYKNNKSSCNVEGLATPKYHGYDTDFNPLMEAVIHNCGYIKINTTDVLHSYHNIILLHKSVYYHWFNPRMQYKGPQMDRIYEKGLLTFPCLTNLDVASVVDLNDQLHKTTSAYLIPIMPFDCVSIKMGFKALCPPSLGVPKYAAIIRVLLEVLP
jgi:hypothetical protein